ncbi:hypothetical protein XOCgx_1968 [Xanthomonas oryzae pv. oryzicola]|nr:hypothetical protein XOCgx_1968 [Xanthomonas oryzae pv. oryzicola]
MVSEALEVARQHFSADQVRGFEGLTISRRDEIGFVGEGPRTGPQCLHGLVDFTRNTGG